MTHEDLSRRAVADTRAMHWTPSPAGEVERKRLFHCGASEAGKVTSIVRYAPGARFHEHAHPDGEEILVLEGVFSDHTGDWPAGTLLLNPEGFAHAPFSLSGCELLVRLRQYAGADRSRVVLETDRLDWQVAGVPGVYSKELYRQAGYADSLRLERWDPGAATGPRHYPLGVEIFVLSGAFSDEHGSYSGGGWLRLPQDSGHAPLSRQGCVLYIKEAGLPALAKSFSGGK